MVELVKVFIRYILDAQEAYRGAGMMMALYFVALIIIYSYCREDKIRKSILIPTVILMIVLYLGVPMFNTLEYYFEFFDGRLFWTLITPIVTAVGITIFIVNIKDQKKRIVTLILIIPICVYCGKFLISDAVYKESTNDYKLPQSSVDLAEYILAEKEEPKIMVPYTIAHPFRQISSNIYLLYGEDATSWRIAKAIDDFITICDEMERVTPDLNMIMPIVRYREVDYIVFDTVYTELCEDGNINIYGYPVDPNYVGDRTSTIDFDDLIGVSVVDDENGIYWDLSAYGLSYEKTFGQYILYKVIY